MIATEGKLARINAAFLKINSTVVLLLTRFLRTSVSRVFILKNKRKKNIRRRSLTLLCCHVLCWFRFVLCCFFFLQVNFWTCLPQLQCFLRPFQSCKLEHRAQIVVTVKKKNMDWYRNIISMPWEVCIQKWIIDYPHDWQKGSCDCYMFMLLFMGERTRTSPF